MSPLPITATMIYNEVKLMYSLTDNLLNISDMLHASCESYAMCKKSGK